MARKTRTPTIKVDGSPIAGDFEANIVSVRVHTTVHAPAVASLRFVDPYFALLDEGAFSVGDELEILLPDAQNSLSTVFKGEVTTLGTEHEAGQLPVLLVEGLSGTHRLATASTYKAYLNQTRTQVVEEIAGRHGLTPSCDASGGPEPYLLQTGTDHAMVTELARGIGFEWFVDGKDLHFRKRPADGGPTLKRSDDTLLRLTASYTGIHAPSKVSVLGWDPAAQEDFSGDAGAVVDSPGATELGSTAPLVTDSYSKAKDAFGTDLLLGATSARDAKEAEAIADSVGLELVSAGLSVEGVAAGDPAIVAGGQVTLEEVGSTLGGTYYVTEVIHEFGVRQETRTTFRCGGHQHPPARLGTQPGGPDSWGRTGLVLGVVTNINDEENLGRVKVRFPSLGEEAESDWARVIIPGVGEDRGFDMRPEVNDEVVVGFERGDVRFPFVLGGVWSGKHQPPEADTSDDGVVVRRQIVSRVGHAITVSDGPNGAADDDPERYVEIALAHGTTTVKIAEDHIKIEAPDGHPITIESGDGTIELTDAGDVEIKANNLTFEAKQKVTMKSGTDTGVKAGTNLKLEGGVKVVAKGVQAALEGSAMAVVKGGMVKIN